MGSEKRRMAMRAIRRESGQTIVLLAAGMVGFLGIVGLSVDVGMLVQTRADLQKIADASAFAGAQDLPNSDGAITTAKAYVTSNGGDAAAAEVKVSGNDTIKVSASKDVRYTFLRVLGLRGSTVKANATVKREVVRGYTFDNVDVFPYAVWGGDRDTSAARGDQRNRSGSSENGSCSYGICQGSKQVFRSNNYQVATGATDPDWDVQGNDFKGYFQGGSEVVEINPDVWQRFSRGGNAVGQEPVDSLLQHARSGRPILVPVIEAASCSTGCGIIDFKIVSWLAIKLDPTFAAETEKNWSGTVVGNYAISKGVTNGPANPPNDLTTWTYTLTE